MVWEGGEGGGAQERGDEEDGDVWEGGEALGGGELGYGATVLEVEDEAVDAEYAVVG